MKVIPFTLFVFCTLFFELRAAEDVNVIEIRYEVYVENSDSLSSYKYNLPYETFHIVSPDHVLTLNKYAADIDEVHVYDLVNGLDYQCYQKDEKDKIAVKSPLAQIPTLVSNTNDEKLYQIGGMRCKKYEIIHNDTKIEIYTTDVFGVNFTPFSQVQGYAMQYTFVDDVYGRVTYVAKSIFPTVTDKSTFTLDDYRITDEVFPEDIRDSFDETIVTKESWSLFKLNKKKIGYKLKLADKTKVTEQSDADSLVVMAFCGFHKISSLEEELIGSMVEALEGKKVEFYLLGFKTDYEKDEIEKLEDIGLNFAYLKDLVLNRFKIKYYPTFILLDKNRKVIKYKIGINSKMLSTFTEKIIELNDS